MSFVQHSLSARLLFGCLIASSAQIAQAEGFVAYALATADLPDYQPGDGKCSYIQNPPQGSMAFCTLRAAIMETNALPGKDTIWLMPSATYTLTIDGADDGGEEGAQAGDLNITSPLLMQTLGAPNIAAIRATIDANGIDRVLYIGSAGDEVELVNVGITGGFLPLAATEFGAGIRVFGPTQLSLRYVDVFDNEDQKNLSGIWAEEFSELHIQDSAIHDSQGHGIYAEHSTTVTVERSAIYENSMAGLIIRGHLTLIDSTVSGNFSGLLAASAATDATMIIVGSTIAQNGDGITLGTDEAIWLINSVLSGNEADCAGNASPENVAALSMIFGDDTCPLGEPANNNRVAAARLSALGHHGGPTPTHRPRTDSPLIDAGLQGHCDLSDTDQRGLPRMVDFPGVAMASCDIGAVELESDVIFWHDYEESL